MQTHDWIDRYLSIAFQIDRHFVKLSGDRLVETAYQRPPAADQELEPSALLVQVASLGEQLADQAFEPQRQRFLEKQVMALETICRRINGELLPLAEEVQRCFDLEVAWIPEAEFQQALATYDALLPGAGPLPERLRAWHKRHASTADEATKRQAMVRIVDELRARTQQLVALPAGEAVELDLFWDRSYSGEVFHSPNYRSQIALNGVLLNNLNLVVENLCHEGYPGHHVELCLKEEWLYRGRGYREQSILLNFCPQGCVSEGIAQYAMDMLFAPNEVERWIGEHLYADLGLAVAPADASAILAARDTLEGAWCNAAFLARDGASDQEVAAYLSTYLLPQDVEFLRTPFLDIVMFRYVFSKRLLRPWMQRPDREAMFKRLLIEPWVPSDLGNPSAE